jgi:hypothetical protein
MTCSSKIGEKPTVSIIVVNYNGSEHLISCLESICCDHTGSEREILVVDNASTDNSLEILAEVSERYPCVKIIRSETNRGYSGGINIGSSRAHGKYVAILNMDLIVTNAWLAPLIEFSDENPQVAAVSPLILLDCAERCINAAGQDIHVTGLGFNRALWKLRSDLPDAPMKVSGIHGGAFVIRKSILEQIGGMDAAGFLYHEDVELSWLLQLMGHELYCVPASVVRHHYFLSMNPWKLFLLERNRLVMLLSNLEPFTFVLLAPMLLLTEILVWGYCLLKGNLFLRAKFCSYRGVFQQFKHIIERRKLVRILRKRSDWQVIRQLSLNYAWKQFFSLALQGLRSANQQNAPSKPFEQNRFWFLGQ